MIDENTGIKVAMVSAASLALDYKKKKPSADIDEIMPHILKTLNERKDAKIAAVAAASRALNYKDRTTLADKQILQAIVKESDDILRNAKGEY